MTSNDEYANWKNNRGNIISSATIKGTKKSRVLDLDEKYPMKFYKGDIINAIGKLNTLDHFYYLIKLQQMHHTNLMHKVKIK